MDNGWRGRQVRRQEGPLAPRDGAEPRGCEGAGKTLRWERQRDQVTGWTWAQRPGKAQAEGDPLVLSWRDSVAVGPSRRERPQEEGRVWVGEMTHGGVWMC